MYSFDEVKNVDPEIAQAIVDEQNRQNSHIELIASENWVSKAVMAAMGSPLTNKYAEGYPGKRYYGGCQCVDVVENLAIERAKELFGCDYANVQPHSGAQANLADVVQWVECRVGRDGKTRSAGYRSSLKLGRDASNFFSITTTSTTATQRKHTLIHPNNIK